MHYKTITLHLLEQNPHLHDWLRQHRMLLAALETYASELKVRHESWQAHLTQTKPGSHPAQIASEAMELAVEELERTVLRTLPPPDDETPPLDGLLAYITRHTSLA